MAARLWLAIVTAGRGAGGGEGEGRVRNWRGGRWRGEASSEPSNDVDTEGVGGNGGRSPRRCWASRAALQAGPPASPLTTGWQPRRPASAARRPLATKPGQAPQGRSVSLKTMCVFASAWGTHQGQPKRRGGEGTVAQKPRSRSQRALCGAPARPGAARVAAAAGRRAHSVPGRLLGAVESAAGGAGVLSVRCARFDRANANSPCSRAVLWLYIKCAHCVAVTAGGTEEMQALARTTQRRRADATAADAGRPLRGLVPALLPH